MKRLINGFEWENDTVHPDVLYVSLRLSTNIKYDINPELRTSLVLLLISTAVMQHMPSLTPEAASKWSEQDWLAVQNEVVRVYGRNWVSLEPFESIVKESEGDE